MEQKTGWLLVESAFNNAERFDSVLQREGFL